MKTYITSDWHFFHKNMIGENGFISVRKKYKTIEQMNEALLLSINSLVTNDDVLIHCGDISMNSKHKEVYNLLTQLKGQLILIKGNHDTSKLFTYINNNNYLLGNGKPKFVTEEVGRRFKKDGSVFYITHYPLHIGENRKNMYNLCGHIHENYAQFSNILNVGVDSPEHPFGFQPMLLEDAINLVKLKHNKAIIEKNILFK